MDIKTAARLSHLSTLVLYQLSNATPCRPICPPLLHPSSPPPPPSMCEREWMLGPRTNFLPGCLDAMSLRQGRDPYSPIATSADCTGARPIPAMVVVAPQFCAVAHRGEGARWRHLKMDAVTLCCLVLMDDVQWLGMPTHLQSSYAIINVAIVIRQYIVLAEKYRPRRGVNRGRSS